jgi:hydrogenase expression/formation protein HypD
MSSNELFCLLNKISSYLQRVIGMAIKYSEEYRDPAISRKIVEQITAISQKPLRLMEVCGTHTMSIFKSGIRELLPETIALFSGPGCPVCVTAQNEIDAFIALSRLDDVIVTSFGDLMRVPGTESSLQLERAGGQAWVLRLPHRPLRHPS